MQFELRPRQRLREGIMLAFPLPHQPGFQLEVATTEQYGTVGKARSIRCVGNRPALSIRRERDTDAQGEGSENLSHSPPSPWFVGHADHAPPALGCLERGRLSFLSAP